MDEGESMNEEQSCEGEAFTTLGFKPSCDCPVESEMDFENHILTLTIVHLENCQRLKNITQRSTP